MAAEDIKKKILETATTLFANKGYDAVDFSEISDASGLAVEDLKKIYKDKTQILNEIIELGVEKGTYLFTNIINQRGKADVKISRLIRTLMENYEFHFPLYKFVSVSMDSTDFEGKRLLSALSKEQVEKYRSNTAIIGRLIAQGQSEGLFGDFDPLEAAYLLRGMISAAVRYWQEFDREGELRTHSNIVTRLFLKGALR